MLNTTITITCDCCNNDIIGHERLYVLNFYDVNDAQEMHTCADCVADGIEQFSALKQDEEVVMVGYYNHARDYADA